MILVRWAIPDMPAELRDKIRREAYITNEIIIKQEAERAQKLANGMKLDPFFFFYFVVSFYPIRI